VGKRREMMLQSAVDALTGTRSGGASGATRRRAVTMTVHVGTALLGLVVLHAMGRALARIEASSSSRLSAN
jgi:hypothetical protein